MRSKQIIFTLLTIGLFLFISISNVRAQSAWEWLRDLLFPSAAPAVTGGILSATTCSGYGDAFSCIGAGCMWFECLGSGCDIKTDYCNPTCACYRSYNEYCRKLGEGDCKANSYYCCYADGYPKTCVGKGECTSCPGGTCSEVFCGSSLCEAGEKCCAIQASRFTCYNPKFYICTPGGPIPCSITYRFVLTGTGACKITFDVFSNCENRKIEVKDSQGNIKFSKTTPLNEKPYWSVTEGTYNYDVFVDGVKDGSSDQLICSPGPITTTTSTTTTTTLPFVPCNTGYFCIDTGNNCYLQCNNNVEDYYSVSGVCNQAYNLKICCKCKTTTTTTSTTSSTTTSTTTLPSCTTHEQCSQACTNLCPPNVLGCCYGCKLGQCVNGKCECVDAVSYCLVPIRQVGSPCIASTTTSTTTSSTTTTTTLPSQFTYSNFNCNDNTKECGMSYTNQVGEPVVVVFYLLRNQEYKQSTSRELPQGSDSFTAPPFNCAPLPSGQYTIMFQVFRKSRTSPYRDPIVNPMESKTITCP
jgi:hypothetical protein